MTDEKKQEFTRRICNANEAELIGLELEMTDTYLSDFISELGEMEKTKRNYELIFKCIRHMQKELYLDSELGRNLFALYQFIENQVTKAYVKKEVGKLMECRKILQTLSHSFMELGAKAPSKPLLENTEQLYVGLTYSGQGLGINSSNFSSNRGFLA